MKWWTNSIVNKVFFLGIIICIGSSLSAHEIRPAFLKISESSNNSYHLFWKVPMTQGKYINILPEFEIQGEWTQLDERSTEEALIREYSFTTNRSIKGSSIKIQNLEKTLIDVLVQVDFDDKSTYSFMVQPTKPFAFVPEDSGLWQTISTYFHLGVEHIWLGYDHLLFVVGLFLLIPGIGPLIKTITSFTIAHSITLALASLGFIKVSSGPVEAIIALSIVLLALEAYNYQKGKTSLTIQYPWIVAFLFGLIHGLGFAGALSEIGLPQKSIPSALLFFNVGVEAGQILFVIALWSLFAILKKFLPYGLKVMRIGLPYVLGSLGMFWLIERVSGF
tara:strand:- start:659 stop:1660 length:1002 start_codon:yes stop_codon:yes gene_type:complete